jgi:endonuclease/exonuclease/phosphatase family metal-dependent hydrolase
MSIVYASWNIKQLGESKTKPTSIVFGTQSIVAIGNLMTQMNADIVAVMEVTLKTFGTDAVKEILTPLGLGWQTLATSNDSTNKPDRYAMFYNENTIEFFQFGWPAMEDIHGNVVKFPNRNPAFFRFRSKATKTEFYVYILHGPEPKETAGGGALQGMKSLLSLKAVQQQANPIIISGDFNVDYNLNSAPYGDFETAGYQVLFKGNKTSLKQKFKTVQDPGTYLKSAYDNIFLSNQLKAKYANSGVTDFVLNQGTTSGLPAYSASNTQQQAEWQTILTNTRNRISDHLPVWVQLNI